MKQLIQSLKTGVLDLPEVPCPRPKPGEVLISTRASLISAGTERMLLEFGKSNWIEKARQQPDKLRQVIEKARTDGFIPTFEAAQAKLDRPISLGYSNVGVVLESDAYSPGTRVVSNGAHAEVVLVPKNLVAEIPSNVSDESAAFTVVGAIALEGIRLIAPSLGETIVVIGLGLIGLMGVQLLKAHGCRVIGVDLDEWKLSLAEGFGAETVNLAKGADPIAAAGRMTGGRGVDGVLITAATHRDEPVHQAAQMCRKKGRIVLTGVTGLHLSRDDFYKKELSFQVSCSYGPGRYDPAYEQYGQDYPPAYVRWTAQRNFEAVLQLMAEDRLRVDSLITHRFPFATVHEAYALLVADERYLGVLLEYIPKDPEHLQQRTLQLVSTQDQPKAKGLPAGRENIAVIGAGAYATRVLLPALQQVGAQMTSVSSNTGMSAQYAARKFDISVATTTPESVLCDASVNAVVIATRHDSHALFVREALQNGKNVFVEKPLALRMEDVDEIERLAADSHGILMIGFNRRFATHAHKMRQLLAGARGPKCVVVTVNAGAVPTDHWTQDERLSGGRLIGEGCHFLDLARFLIGRKIVSARWSKMASDTATLLADFEDKSQASIHYFSNGHRSYPKERVQVFADGKILELDNWRRLRGYGFRGFKTLNLWRQDKGNAACVASWVGAIRRGGEPPIPLEEMMEVSRWTLLATSR